MTDRMAKAKAESVSVRNGADFIARLKAEPRDVWIEGERVRDVSVHPAFKASVHQLAKLYDMQHDPRYAQTLTSYIPGTRRRVGTGFVGAEQPQDLVKRRHAFELRAEATFGLMGRTPDFLNVTLLAFAEARDVFARAGDRFGDNMVKYYEYVRDNDLFLSHALVTPQNDRSRSSANQRHEDMHLRVVKERDDGIVVRGARMLATLGPVADEMFMYNLPIFKKGDEDHALVFAVPTNVKGLRQICREPYDTGKRSPFDHPLSSRFEESDALLIFDDVFVPWERVFVYRNVELSNAIVIDTNVRNHTAHQTNARALAKMQLAVGLAVAVARAVKADSHLHVQQMLGECLGYVEHIKSGLVRSEVEWERTGVDTIRTSLKPLQTLRTFLPYAYPRVIEVLQTIGAGGLMMMPSGADLGVPALAADIERFYQGAEGMDAKRRIKLFKLAWDLAGEAFGQRQLQYERYYAGDPVRLLAGHYTGSDPAETTALVERALALSDTAFDA